MEGKRPAPAVFGDEGRRPGHPAGGFKYAGPVGLAAAGQ